MNYINLYHIIEESTPMKFDCGLICENACCRNQAATRGMLLFPGEEALYAAHMPQGFALRPVTLKGWGEGILLTCEGYCAREQRPLACRIFPLAPIWDGAHVHCRMDQRGALLCPLCREELTALDPSFVSRVEEVFRLLMQEEKARRFLIYLSNAVEEFARNPLG